MSALALLIAAAITAGLLAGAALAAFVVGDRSATRARRLLAGAHLVAVGLCILASALGRPA